MKLRTKLAIGFGVCALLCGLGGWAFTEMYFDVPQANAILDTELAKAKALGLPMLQNEVNTTPEPPAGKNAANDIALWPEKLPAMKANKDLKSLLTDDLASLQTYIKELEPFTTEIDRALEKPLYRMPHDYDLGPGMTFPEFSSFMQASHVLHQRAIISARAGDIRGTLDDLKRMNTVARFAGSEPALLAILVSVAVLTSRDQMVENLVELWKDNPEALNQLEQTYSSNRFRLDPAFAMRGEFYIYLSSVRNYDPNKVYQLIGRQPTDDFPYRKNSPLVRTGLPSSMVLRALLARGVQYHNETYPLWQKFLDDPSTYGKQIETISQTYKTNDKFSTLLTRTLMSVFLDSGNSSADSIARERAMIGLIRAAQIHARTGKWPTTLSALNLEKDPWTKSDLKLIQKGKTFRIYSLGRNLKDNGGVASTEIARSNPDFDIVASFPPAPRRRGPATP